MDDLLREFLTETGESLAALDSELVRLERNPDPALLQGIFRLFHTIKGTCGFLGLPRLEAMAHAAESVLGRIRDGELPVSPPLVSLVLEALDRIRALLAALEAEGAEQAGDDGPLIRRLAAVEADTVEDAPAPPALPPPDSVVPHEPAAGRSIRVNLDLLDGLMTMVSELVLTRNQLLQILRGLHESAFAAPLQRLSQVTTELQEGVMKTRMQPIGSAWAKLPRMVRDLARDLGKTIELELRGAQTELDRQVLELIRDPLTHMVRNSADHGIEAPAERVRRGKAETGRITLDAYHEGGHIVITIADDGSGLATGRIAERAVASGLATASELAALTDQQIRQLVFRPGFSTAASVTSISGRGVGLDVVRANIEKLGGTIAIESVEGRGTVFTIAIPLTLAVVSALIIECGGERFALPQAAVLELVQAGRGAECRIETLNRTPVLRLREKLLPLVSLARLLRLGEGELHATALVIVTEVGGRAFGIAVDRIFDAEEIVVKPVAPILRDIPLYSGNTILGDGSVIMILDPAGLASAAGEAAAPEAPAPARPAERGAQAGRALGLLLFRAGPGARKAVPLGLVERLEEIEQAAIEYADARPVVQYRGRIMPLLTLSPDVPLGQAGRRPVLVFAHESGVMGIVVDEIEDIVEEAVAIERAAERPGLLGSAIIAGRTTDIIDAGFYLAQACGRAAPPARAGRRVLLVEDSAFFRNLLTPLLTVAGYDVTGVESAARAMALCEAGEDFDAILSGIETPGMEGSAFASSLRGSRWRDKPILALAPGAAVPDPERGRDAGFSGTVPKLDRATLLLGLERALEGSRSAA